MIPMLSSRRQVTTSLYDTFLAQGVGWELNLHPPALISLKKQTHPLPHWVRAHIYSHRF